ncbi:MAG TPA: SxtJ family membrane protein [Vicinamibacterales bacterium]
MALKTPTTQQCQDTGMAMVLLLLIVALRVDRGGVVLAALAVQVIAMTVPRWFAPIAIVWLALSHAIGKVVSTILLAVVYAIVVTPVSLVRRLTGKDPLRLKAFRNGTGSAMIVRRHTFGPRDLERPY